MAGPRQRLVKCSSAKSEHQSPEECAPILNCNVALPKHVSLPEVPADSELVFQIVFYLYALMVLGFQYLDLFGTSWWLPYAPTNYIINLDLVDSDLLMILVLVLGYKFIKNALIENYRLTAASGSWHTFSVVVISMFIILTAYIFFLLRSICLLYLKYSLWYLLVLAYPGLTWFVLYGADFLPTQWLRSWTFGGGQKSSPATSVASGAAATSAVATVRDVPPSAPPSPSPPSPPPPPPSAATDEIDDSALGIPFSWEEQATLRHACSTSPEHVRHEVDLLRLDFNERLKRILFEATVAAYYSTVVPACFAENQYHMSTTWEAVYALNAWFVAATLCLAHRLPTQYIDTLHRCAVHLGRWQKIEGRLAHVPHSPWSELQVWQKGVLVKHVKGLFKAEGINNTAEPGNSTHARFYFLFGKPQQLLTAVVLVLVVHSAIELCLMFEFPAWNRSLSLAGILLANYMALYKFVRDLLVVNRAYADEDGDD